MPAVEVAARGTSSVSASIPTVMYGRFRMSAPIRGQSKKWSSTIHTEKCRHTQKNAKSPSRRRKAMGQEIPNTMRRGVIARLASRILSVQIPRVRVTCSMGLAPRLSVWN